MQKSRTEAVPLIPTDGAPAATALRAYSIWTSLPDGLKVVSEKPYRSDILFYDFFVSLFSIMNDDELEACMFQMCGVVFI